MKAKIIKRKPLFRKYQEKYFGGKTGHTLYVKFTDRNRKMWIGGFAKDEAKGLCQVIEDITGSQCLVVANGKGYLVDVQNESLIQEFDAHDHISSVLQTSKPNYLVAGTDNSIFIINKEGTLKEILPDFFVDGIVFQKQQENSISGWLASSINQFEKSIPFKVDLSSFNLILNY